MKVGDRVRAKSFIGIIVEPDEDMLKARETIRNRAAEFWWVRFEGKGPNNDGIGVYHRAGIQLFPVAKKNV